MFYASFARELIRLVQLHVLMQIGSDLFFQVSWALLIFCIFMPELINCKVSLFCLLCFPFCTICWRFSILREREEMKSKLSPGACEIKLACLQCAISIISSTLLSLQFVTSACTKTNISMGKKPESSTGGGKDSNGDDILSASMIPTAMWAGRLVSLHAS